MKPKLFKCFVKDVENLYYKTRLSSIEDCFIRLSQEAEQVDALDFIRWLNSEKKVKGKNSVYRYVTSPELFTVFDYLYDLTTRFKSIESAPGKFRMELFNQNPKLIEMINTLNVFLNDNDINSILLPFQSVIQLISKIFPIPPRDELMIKKDLQVIDQYYNRQQSKQNETSKDLFGFLLNKFGQDIGMALENIGRKDLADKIVSGKILFRPDLLSKIIEFGYVDPVMGEKIKNIVSNAIYKDPQDAYEYIKREALDFVGSIDKKQYDEKQRVEMMQNDVENFQSGSGITQQKINPIDIESSKWLHPRSIAIISTVLYVLYKKIAKI